MERTRLIFLSSELSDIQTQLTAGTNEATNELFMSINNIENDNFEYIFLDRLTAIKLVKHLKREIGKMQKGGNDVE